MNKQNKAFVYNLICFVIVYSISYILLTMFTELKGFWVPVSSAMITFLLTPKFQYARQAGGDKIYMSWMFMKGVKEVK